MTTSATNNPSLLNLNDQSVYALTQTTIIGRHEDCNLVLKSERGASRKHARISIENNTAVLMDLGSLNGTMVNGREISRAVQLSHGDILIFDEHEYRFVSPEPTELPAGDNVTVIANKDEIGRPESIKPAIRVIDTHSTPQPDTMSFDETESWEIPATSRPGGDAITPKRLQEKYNAPRSSRKSRSAWLSWTVIAPLLILLMLIAFYFAYTTGFSAGTIGNAAK